MADDTQQAIKDNPETNGVVNGTEDEDASRSMRPPDIDAVSFLALKWIEKGFWG